MTLAGKPRVLVLPLKKIYFDQIKSGLKLKEYRLRTDYWTKRLEGREYDQIVLTLGYPAADDHAKRLVLPWKGFVKESLLHEHFGPEPVNVYAIACDVRSNLDTTTHHDDTGDRGNLQTL